ncbi:metal-dependent hydrolase [Motiliproteus sp. SC1-56]|uniref:metal-dependent hydrolase n=1 Tax=Motiliproteus sp. SC1-56 TaxID=2799565 RepID=UPI001A8FD94D|nr:metal-dependent hydrolase [Motiliproteus sp. SC1-56]
MDSLSQAALGAAIGTAVLGHKIGYRAALWGSALGTLPDLDVLISFGGPVADFTYHRSFSHSLLVLAAISPFLAWLIRRFHPEAPDRGGWLFLVAAVLLTHPLLDAFTIYGTQLFWPLDTTPFGLGSIFIIDPLYTLPLLAGLAAFLLLRRRPHLARRGNAVGLLLSTLYLAWSGAAQQWVELRTHRQLAAMALPHRQVLVQPAPLNTLLWRVLVMTDNGYREGFHSLLDGERPILFKAYRSEPALLSGLEHHWPVERLQWFTKGFYKVGADGQDIVISDLRMGLEPTYVFSFKVGERGNPHPRARPAQQRPVRQDMGRLPGLWKRIWQYPP